VLPTYCPPGHVTVLACNRTWPSPPRYRAFSHNCLPWVRSYSTRLYLWVRRGESRSGGGGKGGGGVTTVSDGRLALMMTVISKVKLGIQLITNRLEEEGRGIDDRRGNTLWIGWRELDRRWLPYFIGNSFNPHTRRYGVGLGWTAGATSSVTTDDGSSNRQVVRPEGSWTATRVGEDHRPVTLTRPLFYWEQLICKWSYRPQHRAFWIQKWADWEGLWAKWAGHRLIIQQTKPSWPKLMNHGLV
jgi:hypothetical protein